VIGIGPRIEERSRAHSGKEQAMTQFLRLGVALAVLQLAAVDVRAQDYGLGDAKATPASIHAVQSGGHWEQHGNEGFYRVVVTSGGVEHVVSRLYVQWIAIDPDAQAYKLTRTIDVKEVGAASVITPVPKFSTSGNWTMAVTIGRRGGKRERRIVTIRPGGSYSVK
jgi:hypothetical protein